MASRYLCLVPALLALAGCTVTEAATGADARERVEAQGGTSRSERDAATTVKAPVIRPEEAEQLRLSVSDVPAETPAPVRPPVAQGEPLSEQDTARLLSRLPPLEPGPEDRVRFALPERTLPPPRTGETVAEPFPPPTGGPAAPTPGAGPLEVVRYTPEGEVPLAPQVSVTFSQPMVAVTSHAETVAEGVPVRLSPEPEGTWRWVGAKTLLFETDTRLPMATQYTAEIPAGTRSATGGILSEAVRWRFSTPPATVETFQPRHGPQRVQPVLVAVFDQRVEPQAVLDHVRLTGKGRSFPVRLATEAEIADDEAAARLVKDAQPGRVVALRPEAPLPVATSFTLTFRKGLPSAEGPRVTEKPRSFAFQTHGPLRVVKHRCGWRGRCPPGYPFSIELSNPLDPESFDAERHVKVEPPVEELHAEVHGRWLNVRGATTARTKYRVTLAPGLQDTFGQSLGEAVTVTFEVADPQPQLYAGSRIAVLDPAGPPALPVQAVGIPELEISVYDVAPKDWNAFGRMDFWSDRLSPPGRRVVRRRVTPEAGPTALSRLEIDVSEALDGDLGHAVVVVRALKLPKDQRVNPLAVWVQRTRLGLSAHGDAEQMLAWVTDLATGAPVPDATVRMLGGADGAPTGVDGLARLEPTRGQQVLIAEKAGDTAILEAPPQWQRRRPEPHLAWYTVDDRQMYRTGEEVHLKGWVRRITTGPDGDLQPFEGGVEQVSWAAVEPRGNRVAEGKADVDRFGGFDLSFTIPDSANLGHARVELMAVGTKTPHGRDHRHAFQIQAFRTPEYEVTARADGGPYLLGGDAVITAEASYYAGGALPGAEVDWRLTASPGTWRPAGYDGFVFGEAVPWWMTRTLDLGESTVVTHEARTDAAGRSAVRVLFEAGPPRAMNVSAQATVTDVNRQAWSARSELLVHPAAVYPGLRLEKAFVAQDRPIEVDAVVVDLDGRAVPGRPLQITAERLDWRREDGEWKEVAVATRACEVATADAPVSCRIQPDRGGRWRLSTEAVDEHGRRSRTRTLVWVAGAAPPSRGVERDQVVLVPEQETWQPGETARVLVQAPFHPAEGLVTLRREGLAETRRIHLDGPSYTLEVPIEEGIVPGLHLQVDLVGRAARTDGEGESAEELPTRPAYATGEVYLSVPPLRRTLSVSAEPVEREVAPGAKTRIEARVVDAAGAPVKGAELLVVAVDEAILSLTGYRFPDPMDAFYPKRGEGVGDAYLRALVSLTELPAPGGGEDKALAPGNGLGVGRGALMRKRNGGGGVALDEMTFAAAMPTEEAEEGEQAGGQAGEAIDLRADLNPLALFAPSVVTDARGHAEVSLELPDNVTRYRVMAVATDGGRRFGQGESTLTARLPLMVRPSAPRFLNFGDAFELPVVVQNQTDAPLSVDVALRASALELTGAAGRRVRVPARDRVEVRFPAKTGHVGTARFQTAAASGSFADAASGSLPVWTPGTTEAFATYGTLDEGAMVQPVKAPADAAPEIGGLEVTTSSTALQGLTDAVLYLVEYPYECSEQIASRVLSIAALRDVLSAFEAEGLPEPGALLARVEADLETLGRRQNPDGGFGLWRTGRSEWPFLSVHVTHALARAQDKGFEVPKRTWSRAQRHLRTIEQHIPSHYGPAARRAVIAYALYVRRLMGDADPARAARLVKEAGGVAKMPLETLGWVLPVLAEGDSPLVAQIHRFLEHRVSETAATAQFTTDYGDGAWLLFYSSRRTDALLLEGLVLTRPKSDLIVKLVRGLLGHRTRGRWLNTQENTWVLVALDRYFQTFEKQTPDFVARAWLGDRFAAEQAFRGRSTERRSLEVPMEWLAREAPGRLILQKEGEGRLYYRVGLRYAPEDLTPEPADHGFTVLRTYEAVDDPSDVRRDEDGVWHVKAGAKVRVRLSMVAPARRYHVALEDRLPAGFEAVNPALAVSEQVPDAPVSPDAPGAGSWARHWWWGPWFEHQNLRDARAEAFSSLVWAGVHEWSYVARATTPGRFVAPAPKAEEMYHPETFGRGAGEIVVVE